MSVPLKTRAIVNGHRRVSSINIDELIKSYQKDHQTTTTDSNRYSSLQEIKRNSASVAENVQVILSSTQEEEYLAVDSSFRNTTPNTIVRKTKKLSEMVQASKNLLTGALISDGNSHYRQQIWKEVPNYNAIDFNKVNMKAAIISESKIKNAKEASRLIRNQNKQYKSSSRASTKNNTSQTHAEPTMMSTGRQTTSL